MEEGGRACPVNGSTGTTFGPTAKASTKGRDLHCHICQRKGHWAKNCPSRTGHPRLLVVGAIKQVTGPHSWDGPKRGAGPQTGSWYNYEGAAPITETGHSILYGHWSLWGPYQTILYSPVLCLWEDVILSCQPARTQLTL